MRRSRELGLWEWPDAKVKMPLESGCPQLDIDSSTLDPWLLSQGREGTGRACVLQGETAREREGEAQPPPTHPPPLLSLSRVCVRCRAPLECAVWRWSVPLRRTRPRCRWSRSRRSPSLSSCRSSRWRARWPWHRSLSRPTSTASASAPR